MPPWRNGCILWVATLGMCLLSPDPVVAQETYENGADTSFAFIDMPAYATFRGAPVPLAATVVFAASAQIPRDGHVMFSFHSESPRAQIQLLGITTGPGREVPIESEERDAGTDTPKVFVRGADLPAPGASLLLLGEATADGNGRFQIGAFVLAFDEEWAPYETGAGDPSSVYAFTRLGSDAFEGGAPFEGSGNSGAPIALLVAVGGAAGGGYAWTHWRLGRPQA